MPTTVITGRDVTFTLDAADYDAQTTSAVLSCETIIETYQTLDGRAYKSVDKQWTFTIELLQDWGAASSLFEAMWADAESAPNTHLAVAFTAITGAVFAFNVLPIFPNCWWSCSWSTYRYLDNDSNWNTNRDLQLRDRSIGSYEITNNN
jgi:hypothetical protein